MDPGRSVSATANQDSGNSSCSASNLIAKPIDSEKELKLDGTDFKNFELITLNVPQVNPSDKMTVPDAVINFFSDKQEEYCDRKVESATNSPRQRRICVNNLLAHPLARVVSNKSFKRLKDEEGKSRHFELPFVSRLISLRKYLLQLRINF